MPILLNIAVFAIFVGTQHWDETGVPKHGFRPLNRRTHLKKGPSLRVGGLPFQKLSQLSSVPVRSEEGSALVCDG
jgi:hypothetical protein